MGNCISDPNAYNPDLPYVLADPVMVREREDAIALVLWEESLRDRDAADAIDAENVRNYRSYIDSKRDQQKR